MMWNAHWSAVTPEGVTHPTDSGLSQEEDAPNAPLLPVRYAPRQTYGLSHRAGCVCIDSTPCKIHTVDMWRVLQGGLCVHVDSTPCKIHTVDMWRVLQGGEGVPARQLRSPELVRWNLPLRALASIWSIWLTPHPPCEMRRSYARCVLQGGVHI